MLRRCGAAPVAFARFARTLCGERVGQGGGGAGTDAGAVASVPFLYSGFQVFHLHRDACVWLCVAVSACTRARVETAVDGFRWPWLRPNVPMPRRMHDIALAMPHAQRVYAVCQRRVGRTPSPLGEPWLRRSASGPIRMSAAVSACDGGGGRGGGAAGSGGMLRTERRWTRRPRAVVNAAHRLACVQHRGVQCCTRGRSARRLRIC